ncbi:MAG: hypothetical protein KTR15_01725 [Phycisphaeraceae bacterium]|nr:hypothetical protein [Phycisphaeraceae bacterium]
MRWFGQVYIPMMAVLGLLFIVLSFFFEDERAHMATTMMITGAILAAGACIGGAIQQGKS